ncbi:39327_t:CDS:2, partial [Gigaspora margarita]
YPHTANVIKEKLEETIEAWGLTEKVYSITTNNGANMKAAIKKMNNIKRFDARQSTCSTGQAINQLFYGAKAAKTLPQKSTNRLDNILQLTENGRLRVQQIRAGIKSDIHVWRWVWFCSGDGGCQRSCGRFGDCIKECNYYSDQHNFNNPFNMHKCSIRILTEVMLLEIDTEFPVCMTIKGIHVPQNIIRETTALFKSG